MADENRVSYVRIMREIRDQVNREISGMTFEEERQWIEEQLAKSRKLPEAPAEIDSHTETQRARR